MLSHHISVHKTARYFTHGELHLNTHEIWIVLHGYAQMGSTFLQLFQPMYRPDRYFIAPEGLSKFYLRGGWEEVGASWMTREDRATDMQDYKLYLDTLYDTLNIAHHPAKIVVLGFSQGVATLTRWLHGNTRRADTMILCAGEPAKELQTPESMASFTSSRKYYIYGTSDHLLTAENTQLIAPLLSTFDIRTFEGVHEVNIELINELEV